ncbi:MAG: restriction endonuclease subunit S [Acidobacteriota bacterium]
MSNLVQFEWPQTTIKASSYLKGRIGWHGLKASEFTDHGPYLITGTDFRNGRIEWSTCYHVTEQRFQEGRYIHIRDGDLLITKDGTIGKVAYVTACPTKAVLNSGIFLIRCSDGSYEHRFLYHLLQSHLFAIFLRLHLAGSTINHLYQNVFERFDFPIPDIRVQRRFADILDLIDGEIRQTEELIAKYQQIKAGLMHDLLTRGVTSDGHLRPSRVHAPHLYNESSLGWIPKTWQLSSCAAEFVVDSGITLGPHRRANNTPHPYLRVANVFRDSIVLDDVAQLEAFPGEIENTALKTFDLLVVEGHANRQEIGRCAMVLNDAEGMLFQNHLFRLRAIRCDPRYSLLWLNSFHAQHYWELNCATSSGLNTINRRALSGMQIGVPPPDEQQLIVSASLAYREDEAANATHLAKLRQQKHGLMHDLLTGHVRIQVEESEVA